MKAPKYLDDEAGSTCSICGCLVANQDRHTSFHESLARLLGIQEDAEDWLAKGIDKLQRQRRI